MAISQKNASQDFKGNKSTLPKKICQHCGKVMVWRKSWAKNWSDIRYCSDRCRNHRTRSELYERTLVISCKQSD